MKKYRSIRTFASAMFLLGQFNLLLLFGVLSFFSSAAGTFYYALIVAAAATITWMTYKFVDPFKHMQSPSYRENNEFTNVANWYIVAILFLTIAEGAIIFFLNYRH